MTTSESLFLMRPLRGDPGTGADFLLGVEPRRSGVEAGSFLSNNSGLNFGPKDTRFFLAALSRESTDFLFSPRFTDFTEMNKTHLGNRPHKLH